MLKVHRLFIALGIVFMIIIAYSLDKEKGTFKSGFSLWVSNVAKELAQEGVSLNTIDLFVNSVVENDLITKKSYDSQVQVISNARSLIDDDMILQSQIFYSEKTNNLLNYEKAYNVKAPLVVAMLGIGSRFGSSFGDYRLVDVLANLAYKSEYKDFYKKELIYLLKMIDMQYFDMNVVGHSDGTFTHLGISPSVYYYYGVDGDKNGKVDLFTSKLDILHTGFFILKSLGVDYNQTWGSNVSFNGISLMQYQGRQNAANISTWLLRGVIFDTSMKPQGDPLSTLIIYKDKGNGLLLYKNFDFIFKANKVLYKSIAIGYLYDVVNDYASIIDYKDQNVEEEKKVKQKEEPKVKKDDQPLSKKLKKYQYVK